MFGYKKNLFFYTIHYQTNLEHYELRKKSVSISLCFYDNLSIFWSLESRQP